MVPSRKYLRPTCNQTNLPGISQPGKRGRVIIAVDNLTAHNSNIEEKIEVVPASIEESLHGDMDPDSTACTQTMSGAEMYLPATEMNIVDLYTVGLEEFKVLE